MIEASVSRLIGSLSNFLSELISVCGVKPSVTKPEIRVALLPIAAFLLASCAGNPPVPPPPHYQTEEGRIIAEQLATDDPAEIRRRWGAYADLIDKQWFMEQDGRYSQIKMEWLIKGSVLKLTSLAHVSDNSYLLTYIYQYNPVEGRLDGYTTSRGEIDRIVTIGLVQPDGSILTILYKPSDRKYVGTTTTWFDRARNTYSNETRGKRSIFWQQSDAEFNAMRRQGQKYQLEGEHKIRRDEERSRQLAAEQQKAREAQAFRQGLYNGLVTINEELKAGSQASSASLLTPTIHSPQAPNHTANSSGSGASTGHGASTTTETNRTTTAPAQYQPVARTPCPMEWRTGKASGYPRDDQNQAMESMRRDPGLACGNLGGYALSNVRCNKEERFKTEIVNGKLIRTALPDKWSCHADYQCTNKYERCPAGSAAGSSQ